LQGSKLTFKSHFEGLPWGMTNGYMLEVRFMIDSNYLQCIPSNTFTHNEKPRFIYLTKLPNIDGVNGQKVKMCVSTMESKRGSNNVHFVSKHVSKNGFWVNTSSLGFWVRLGFAQWYEAIAFLWD
jgi:hypothetical protein